ncbi:tRNA (adenosine(37)-N6)-threonylcarbamoyltransferase complex ATPase subunit type 1 TsaE [Roseovarius sp. MBR-6]|uniref:tRNA (adenosine(37)-N6)-threonylcarbamoyltransferase complex ATPase subunit type 1 TsaE n=1 Tax=Roseovarius sp. MBR-6 TaxID=3156459 RepID=UPI00339430BC
MTSRTLYLASPAETCALAQRLAPRLGPGDVLLLSGGVGAGKTHFARCLIQSLLPSPEDVPSPTYTLVQTYPGPHAGIWHADLYRLTQPGELVELGLTEAFETDICLVEWPDRLGDLAPGSALLLDLAPGDADEARRLTLRWSDPRWTSRLEGIADA